MSRKLLIGMYAAGLPFNGNTLEEKSLGGSETALLYMARELAARGHDVKVFNNCDKPGRYDGVDYFNVKDSWSSISPLCEFDVFIASRNYQFLTQKIQAKLIGLWNHDIITEKTSLMTNLWNIDFMWCLSDFHAEQYLSIVPEIKTILYKTRNGVDLKFIDSIRDRRMKREKLQFVYGSRPERGLDTLLIHTWPKILKEIDQDAELIIAGYSSDGIELPEHIVEYYKYIDKLLKTTKNVKVVGSLTKEKWYELLCTSTALLYPTKFPEISCIIAMEAQACGLPIVTSANFALNETVADKANLISNHPQSEEYQNAFVARVKKLVKNEFEYKLSQKKGRQSIEGKYEWHKIAEEWEDFLWEQFETRSLLNGGRNVLKNFVYKSDLLAAKWALENTNQTGVSLVECEEIEKDIKGYLTQHHADPEEYAVGETIDDSYWEKNARFTVTANAISEYIKDQPFTLLDVGCGGGGFLAHILKKFEKQVEVQGIDFSQGLLDRTADLLSTKFNGIGDPKSFLIKGDFLELTPPLKDEDRADIVVAGEWLEHQVELDRALLILQQWAKPTGRIFVTVPNGPWEAISFRSNRERFHVSHFEFRDLEELFGKKEMNMEFVPIGISPIDGSLLGNWVVSFSADREKPFGKLNYLRKFKTMRPYQSISACLITKNEEDNIAKCLKTIRQQVDEIIVLDTGSTDDTVSIARKYADKVVDFKWTDDFSDARNASVALAQPDADWIYWMDADEVLVGQDKLRKYLNTKIFNGFVITQNHLVLDMPNVKPDVPVRIYRNNVGIKFYGCIHEHCELALDKPIAPVLILPDVKIVHYGYITEGVRRDKCKNRNLDLLKKDREKYPERQLGIVLMMRDYLNISQWELEASKGEFTDRIITMMQEVIRLHRQYFNDQSHMYHELSSVLYQRALIALGRAQVAGKPDTDLIPFEIVFGLGGAVGGMQEPEKVMPKSYWFLDREEFNQFLTTNALLISDTLKLPEATKKRK